MTGCLAALMTSGSVAFAVGAGPIPSIPFSVCMGAHAEVDLRAIGDVPGEIVPAARGHADTSVP